MKKRLSTQIPIVVIALIGILIFTMCHDPLDPSVDYMTYDDSQGIIGNGGGKITLNDPTSTMNGASLEIPVGALTTETQISISIDNSVRPTDNPSAEIIKLEPDGIVFSKPLTLKIPVNTVDKDIDLFYFVPDSDLLIKIPFVDSRAEDGSIKSELKHFSRIYLEKGGCLNFNISLYSPSNNIIKANLTFSGKDGLSYVKIYTLLQIFKNYPANAQDVIKN